jgi:hypothetical protein
MPLVTKSYAQHGGAEMSKQTQSLDERIGQALAADAKTTTIEDLQSLIADVENGIREGDKVVEMERAKSLDPVVPDADAAAQRSNSAELKCRRLGTALVRLRKLLSAARADEMKTQWYADCKQVAAERCGMEERFKRYFSLVDEMIDLFADVAAVNREISRVNSAAPDGVNDRLAPLATEASISKNCVLPDFKGAALWPPPQPTLAASYAAMTMPQYDPAYSADWARAREVRADQLGVERQRRADYYANLTKQQEERQNREERAAFEEAQRRRG